MYYEPVIGLEVHAELATRSKMFCACAVVDATRSQPNTAVCPVCLGLPGVLPVVNRAAVELALRVALALGCRVNRTSIFARKNYFYPDLPKGYQISQYENPLAVDGLLPIETPDGWRDIRIRRVHLEEDTGKLTHVHKEGEDYSLVDLNRAGVPLLEIVSEPDLHSAAEVRAYAQSLRAVLRYVGASSGDMEKGALRIEPNISIRPVGSQTLGTRVEIKNLNSFRTLEQATAYQIEQQALHLLAGRAVMQETLGWNESTGTTFSQRSKEEAHDYRYFPEPDLPPLVVEAAWVDAVRAALPELPVGQTGALHAPVRAVRGGRARTGGRPRRGGFLRGGRRAVKNRPAEDGSQLDHRGSLRLDEPERRGAAQLKVDAHGLAALLDAAALGTINLNTAKSVLGKMLESGKGAEEIIREEGLEQVSDGDPSPDWCARRWRPTRPSWPNSWPARKRWPTGSTAR